MPIRTNRDLTRASRFLSLVLRHKPDTAGIVLDASFWQATNGVWLCEAVPAARLAIVDTS